MGIQELYATKPACTLRPENCTNTVSGTEFCHLTLALCQYVSLKAAEECKVFDV